MSSTPFSSPQRRSSLWHRLPRRAGEGGLFLLAVLGCVASLGAAGQAPAEVRTVPVVDLDRYLGDWFEVSRLPNWFQRDCAGDVRASYSRQADGRIEVINRCASNAGASIEARGVARVVDAQSRAKLKVRFAPSFLSFLPMVWGDYWILGLGSDYSWAVVGSPDRKYLWILSREASPPPAQYTAAVAIAKQNGFAVDNLVVTAQSGRR